MIGSPVCVCVLSGDWRFGRSTAWEEKKGRSTKAIHAMDEFFRTDC